MCFIEKFKARIEREDEARYLAAHKAQQVGPVVSPAKEERKPCPYDPSCKQDQRTCNEENCIPF